MEGKRLVPKRRNSKYSGVWIEKEFNDLGNFGKIYPFSRSEEGAGRFHHIHYGDIHTKSFGIVDNSSELPKIKVEENFELAKPGDIVIADASEDYKDLGKSVVIGANTNRQIIAGLHTFKFTPNEHLYPLFYLYYSQTRIFKKFSYKTGTGISVFGMSKDNLGKMRLYIPTIKEQQNIGEFFKALDERIANQKRKIDKVKALKAAYLTEMFPQEGETVPKRRFKGFDGEWERKVINEIMDVTSVKRIHQSDWEKEGIRFLRARDIVSFYKNEKVDDPIYISKEKYEEYTKASGKVNTGDLLVTGVGTIGIPMLIKNDNPIYFKDGNIIWFKNNNYLDGHYLYYYFTTKYLQNYIEIIAGIGTVGTYTIEGGKQTPIYFPDKYEQQKIGEFFKNLDDQIEMEEKKLDKHQKMKEAYLEEMFV